MAAPSTPDPDPASPPDAPGPNDPGSASARRAGRQGADETARTRERILDAAEAAFARHGFEGASLRTIAEGAGVTHGLLRHHFGGKEGLWRAVVERAVADYAAAYAPVLTRLGSAGAVAGPGGPDAAATCRLAAHGFARVSRERPALMRLLVHEGDEPGPRLDHLLATLEPLLAALEPLFAKARAEGSLRSFPGARPFDLFLICALGTPFAVPAFANALLGSGEEGDGDGAIDSAAADAYVEAIVATLFGPAPGSGEV